MSRNLAFTLLRQGSTGDEILQILNTLTDGLVSETNPEDFNSDTVDYEVEDFDVEEYEPDPEFAEL